MTTPTITIPEGLLALAIALNLAYINLSNLRFTDRLMYVIRNMLDGRDPEIIRDDISIEYPYIWKLGDLHDYKGGRFREPSEYEEKKAHVSKILARIFLYIYCNNVTKDHIISTDKLISSICLAISCFFLFALYGNQAKVEPDILVILFFGFFVISALVALIFVIRANYENCLIMSISTILGYYWVWRPGWIPNTLQIDVRDQQNIYYINCALVLIPTLLVLFSAWAYPTTREEILEILRRLLKLRPEGEIASSGSSTKEAVA